MLTRKHPVKRGSDRQPEAYPFFFRVHRHDPDRIHLHRYFPAVAELCAELCKRKCRLGESVHHADLLFSRNHAGTRCNRIPDQKIKDVRFIVVYPAICLVTMVAVLMGQSKPLMIAGAFIIGWAGAGGLLQIATSVCNMLFQKIKGTVTALVMIASSLCNYTILTAASKMQPSGVMTMNIVLTAVGVALGLFVNIRYKKWLNLHSRTIKMRLRIAEVRSTR